MAKRNLRRVNGMAYKRDLLRKRVATWGLPCALCGKPIDSSLTTWIDPKDGKRKRHPLSYELDEIIPVSKGGSPIDPDNVQPTHRICNQKRGNRPMVKKKAKQGNQTPTSREW